MENSEKAIEKVLAGLRDAEASVGMERRIVEAVQERAAVGSGLGLVRWLPIWWETQRVGWIAGAGAVAVFAAVAMLYMVRRAPDLPKRHLVAVEGMPSASSKGDAGNAQRVTPAGMGRPEVQERLGLSRPARRARERVVDDGDAVALIEMRAASHPAPPMPLTEQERLLLRIAHKGDPVELAMLDPMQRAARNAEEQTEFQRFFGAAPIGQPTTGESMTEPSTASTTEQPTTEQSPAKQPATEQSPTR